MEISGKPNKSIFMQLVLSEELFRISMCRSIT